MKTRRALKIEYDGSDFHGWQLQPAVRTVQGALERAVGLASGERGRVVLHGAGRTDAGVHARAQVAHFDSTVAHDPETFMRAINYWLPEDVSVTALNEVSGDFHARFSVEKKTYCYSIIRSISRRPLSERYCLRWRKKPEVDLLNACANIIVGYHDFSAFTSSGGDAAGTEKNIFRSEWVEHGELLRYFVVGDGFTYNMVRSLVGTMLEAAEGNISVQGFAEIMETGDRALAGPTAPARGLMLVDVKYPDLIDPFPGRTNAEGPYAYLGALCRNIDNKTFSNDAKKF